MLSVDRLLSKHWQKPEGFLGDRLQRQRGGPSLGWVQTPGGTMSPASDILFRGRAGFTALQ